MKYIKGNALDGEFDVLWHNCNQHVVFGAGIAHQIKKRWPEVYQADIDYNKNILNPDDKLGTFSKAVLENDSIVYNLYGQKGIGNDGAVLNRNCRYDHLYDAMYRACLDMEKLIDIGEFKDIIHLAVPKIGCGLAGGSWTIVEAMLKDLEERFRIIITVYDFN